MIETKGKRSAEKEAQAELQRKRKAILAKRPAKTIDKLTAQEKKEALDTMLEWFLNM